MSALFLLSFIWIVTECTGPGNAGENFKYFRGEKILRKEVTAKHFSRLAGYYSDSPDHVRGIDLQYIADQLGRLEGERALDVSTGAGHTAGLLAQKYHSVVALDLAFGMLIACRNLYGVQDISLIQGDAENIPLQNDCFSFVTCRIAPHHFTDVKSFVREVKRVLTPGGRFILIDSTVPGDEKIDRFINEMEALRDPTHVESYTKENWRAILESESFEIIDMRSFRKRHDFSSWLNRTSPSPERAGALEKMLVESSSSVKQYLDLEVRGRKVIAYTDEKTIFHVKKRDS